MMSKRLYVGIDLQEGFLNDEIRASDYIEKVKSYLSSLDKSQVVLTRFVNQPGGPFITIQGWDKMQPGDPDNRLFGDLETAGYEIVEKYGYSAWSLLETRVQQEGIEELVLFGLDSDACVLKTALDAFEADIRPIVLEDLCGNSGGKERRDIGIELTKTLCGEAQVMTSRAMPGGA
jgi:nicotinamidase-related amidase